MIPTNWFPSMKFMFYVKKVDVINILYVLSFWDIYGWALWKACSYIIFLSLNTAAAFAVSLNWFHKNVWFPCIRTSSTNKFIVKLSYTLFSCGYYCSLGVDFFGWNMDFYFKASIMYIFLDVRLRYILNIICVILEYLYTFSFSYI